MGFKFGFKETAAVTVLLFAAVTCSKKGDDVSAALLLLAGIQPSGVSAKAVAENYAFNVVVPIYKDLKESSDALHAASLNLKSVFDNGSSTNADKENAITAARNAWKDARIYWEYSEAFLFGPVDTNGFDPALDSWPLDKNGTDTAIASASTALNVNEQKGFHAAEYILFDNGSGDGGKSAAEVRAAMNNNKINYLIAVTSEIKSKTADLYNQWSGENGYAMHFRNAGNGQPPYMSIKSALEEIVKGMEVISDEVTNGKLEPVNTNDVTQVESRFSWNSREDFANNIKGVQWVWRGDYTNRSGSVHTGPGLYELVKAHNESLAAAVDEKIQNAHDAILAIPHPFRNNLNHQNSHAAVAAMQELLHVLSNELKPYISSRSW